MLLLATSLFSCYFIPGMEPTEKVTVGVMSGPTGMGMAKLMNDYKEDNEKYDFKVYSSPNDAIADLANGTVQLLCLPTNTAATLATKENDYISVIAVNCLGSLYLMTDQNTKVDDIKDLDGKTIYASVKNSTTGPIIDYLLEKNNVNANVVFEPDHDALVAKIAKGEVSIAVLPEPKVSAARLQNSSYSVDLNLSDEWNKISSDPLTMGCIVVRNDFLKSNKTTVDVFLRNYKDSIEYIGNESNLEASAQMIVDAGVLPKLPIAKNSLSNLYGSIVYIDGIEMKEALNAFYDAIGQAKPSDEFYYSK